MQVLSQLSYNPTVGPLIGADIVAPSRPGSSPGCSTGEFRVPFVAGFHRVPARFSTMGNAYCSRVIASAGVYQPIQAALNPVLQPSPGPALDTIRIFTR